MLQGVGTQCKIVVPSHGLPHRLRQPWVPARNQVESSSGGDARLFQQGVQNPAAAGPEVDDAGRGLAVRVQRGPNRNQRAFETVGADAEVRCVKLGVDRRPFGLQVLKHHLKLGYRNADTWNPRPATTKSSPAEPVVTDRPRSKFAAGRYV